MLNRQRLKMDKIRRSRTLKKFKLMFTSRTRKARSPVESCDLVEGYGKPSVIHATIVIFLEFFAWGLLTSPTIQALKVAFPTGTFLKNGIVQGVKGILSFLSAPLIGALSDSWGRKSFLLLAVFFTCAPIPILLFNATAYFIAVAVSGIFAVTFSVVFAYVADCTSESERGCSYGLVSATFAASLVISPALGTYIDTSYSHGQAQVIIIATLITAFNLMFIVFMVPESLHDRKATWGAQISWEQVDPFSSLRKATTDGKLLRLSIMVFLSYLPEAGQYSCFFLYLSKVAGFSLNQVAIYIAVLCVTSVAAQTIGLSWFMSCFGYKYTIIIGLLVQATQLFIFGVWTTKWLMWIGGLFSALSTIIYPAISALVSKNANPEQQGVALGILTGVRGLCNGLGPALFGLLFWLFHVNLNDSDTPGVEPVVATSSVNMTTESELASGKHFAGTPFLFGVVPVLIAMIVACTIKDNKRLSSSRRNSEEDLSMRGPPHTPPLTRHSVSSNS